LRNAERGNGLLEEKKKEEDSSRVKKKKKRKKKQNQNVVPAREVLKKEGKKTFTSAMNQRWRSTSGRRERSFTKKGGGGYERHSVRSSRRAFSVGKKET